MSYSQILVAYDGSNISEKALNTAVQLAKSTPGAKLDVIHVFYLPSFIAGEAYIAAPPGIEEIEYERANRVVERAKQTLQGVEGVEVALRQGSPAQSILEYAEERKSDLIIIGSRGLGPVKEFFLGSVSHYVVQQSKVPVLIVK